jgi:hypothetical protein
VNWGCVDFDEGEEESLKHARNLQALLGKFGMTAWVERSRSKGYHVWVFGDVWMSAASVRRGLLVATHAVGAPTREINPKSEGSNDLEFLGNYVRLPYPGWCNGDDCSYVRRVVINEDGTYISVLNFVDDAIRNRGWGRIDKLASRWTPPVSTMSPRHDSGHPESELGDLQGEALEDALRRVSPSIKGILNDGPIGTRDRSSTLYWLANALYEHGRHSYTEIVGLLMWADCRWGKYHSRNDFERRITEMVDKAWNNR